MEAAERKLATVLFADLVGSTALEDQEDPKRTRVMLERFYDAMAEEIGGAGGTVEKFAGPAAGQFLRHRRCGQTSPPAWSRRRRPARSSWVPVPPRRCAARPSSGRRSRSARRVPEIADPDDQTEIYEELIPPCALIGRFDEALRLVGTHAELSRRLTPHHRIHSIAMELEVRELMGDWESIQERRPLVERLVGENLETPCIRNDRSLLVAAFVAWVRRRARHGSPARRAGAGDRLRGIRAPPLRAAHPAGAAAQRARCRGGDDRPGRPPPRP